ncbi:AraC family transcriptional regulator [Pseudomonas syringae]|uniref:AraC family transcriptional regulator n=1 Tax=Pseudomonas syringae TaxID=317 RepID=UPI000464C5F4|nr:AraC family transcriptional regulator [Pseudomonas syringae]MCF5200491.1 helix-turn-helix domain-containing protein [Pseudomonas syringae]MCF5208492.1 helix-turn-helix domain-containing protein [Pseudomonas syringae]MCF5214804.1 helix-turn-helix domain-containing protein [Pseudomonas syringae]MCF5220062.1 helix-turn-helix domain-containing protein [Pseudomonas syringae]MCF5268266.1 helix-turn-helix domain-containing protein [Pseudomonas syringae]
MDNQLDELRLLAAKAENRRTETGIPRVAMVQGKIPEHMLAAVYDPMINVILQGSKHMTVGDSTLEYDPATYFVMSIDLPAVGSVHPARSGEPYLAVSLTLDPAVLSTLFADLPKPASRLENRPGFSVAPMTAELMDAWVRMLRLMGDPDAIAALAPVYEREIIFRVLQGPHGWMLREIAAPDTAMARVNMAIQWIRRDFAEPLGVERLAERASMSVSAFHRHFKAVTNLSPLQYQKRVRLLHARTLMVANAKSVMAAAFEVGYESATQFSRDYSRVFGLPPAQDAGRILEATRGAAVNQPLA